MSIKEHRCLVLKKNINGKWLFPASCPGWGKDRINEPGNGKTYFDVDDLLPGDYNIIRMEFYDTWGSGQPRSYFVKVTRPPTPKMRATETSLAEAEYGAKG